jgi:formylglycine-generating enzyme
MHRTFCSLFLFCAISLVALPTASGVSIAWSMVGNAGNANDSATGNLYGAVAYNYYIGTYDVTNNQYVEFLNAKDPNGTSPLQLYNVNMSNGIYGGISYTSSAASGSKYSVMGSNGQHPVNYETWYSAIRFANWLNNGQGSGDTETGAYTLLGGTATPSNGNSITRNAGATVFLPSESEWYKAAYYDSNTSTYNLYANSSSLVPTATGPTALANHANYNLAVGNLTDVGAYSGTTSPYGAFDMGGNVFQWNETLTGVSSRGARGAAFGSPSYVLLSSSNDNALPTFEIVSFGFRVASNVPEPDTAALVIMACGMMWVLRKRFK